MYRPNFCADCGVRVERARWRPWTSRRFCAACERRFRRGRLARTLLLCASLVGLGFALGRAGRAPQAPLVLERAQSSDAVTMFADGVTTTAGGASEARDSTEAEGATDLASKPGGQAYGPDGTERERPTDPEEVVSICGARTQKGTPCSRRVRGTGRCWQHRGRAAMLRPEKLIVPD
ncbi:MAG TPA: hypothetical protein VFX96_20250 [Pyrinomonadaceae bacterium]|nr:hypothetical protein [Pyrinomonadaceae bacterium]